jgi:hypothetical protein
MERAGRKRSECKIEGSVSTQLKFGSVTYNYIKSPVVLQAQRPIKHLTVFRRSVVT